MKKINMDQLQPDFFDYKEFKDWPKVQRIIDEVRERKDQAVKEYTVRYDHVKIDRIKVENQDIKSSYNFLDKDLISQIQKSIKSLEKFSSKQMESYKNFKFEINPGVLVGQKVIPIDRVGIYVPGGRYPLISSLIMGAVPARIAGVKEIIVCSPPCFRNNIHPGILVAADICGVNEIFMLGGAQAIAAMAYGTQSIPRVSKIVGPGNSYVNAAKKIVYGQVGIDFIAGPTEILVMADNKADPTLIAADLIAQAEHDSSAEPILVTDSNDWADKVIKEIEKGLNKLKNPEVAENSLQKKGIIILVENMNEAVEFANKKAPEHLHLVLDNAESFIPRLNNYGSLFIGKYSPVVLGDYSSGLNHILPTNFTSRYTGGLSVKDFVKIQTFLETNKQGFSEIRTTAMTLASIEGLEGHVNSIAVRMDRE